MKLMSCLLLATLIFVQPVYAGVADGYGSLSKTTQKAREAREMNGSKAGQERRKIEENLLAKRKQLNICRNLVKSEKVEEANKEAYMKNCMRGF